MRYAYMYFKYGIYIYTYTRESTGVQRHQLEKGWMNELHACLDSRIGLGYQPRSLDLFLKRYTKLFGRMVLYTPNN